MRSNWQDATGAELTAELLKQFGAARIRVQGSSMLPSLRPGDEIELQSSSPSEIKTGEIVAYRRDNRIFVHRVVGSTADGQLLAKGDTLPQADAPVSDTELIGTVAAAFRDGKRIDHRSTRTQRLAATLLRRIPLCAALFVKLASL